MQREALETLLLEQPHLKTVKAYQLKLAFQCKGTPTFTHLT